MRKLLLVFVPAILCAVFILSCQKEIDPSILTGPQNDSTSISKFIELDTTLPAGSDTLWITSYFYDAQKRLSKVYLDEYDVSGYLGTDSVAFRYQGNQTLPSSYKYLDPGPDSTVNYLTYSNGFITRDSAVEYSSGVAYDAPEITTVKLLSGNKYEKRSYAESPVSSGNFITLDSIVFTRTIINGNIAAGVDSSLPYGIWANTNSYQYAYDNKPGIFKDIQVMYLGYYGNLTSWLMGFGNNNIVSGTINQSGPGGANSYNTTINYTYRSDGRPIIIRASGVTTNKVIIKYTKL